MQEDGTKPGELCGNWLSAFELALGRRDQAALARLFASDGHWRDQIALTWDIGLISGAGAVSSALISRLVDGPLTGWRIDPERPAPASATIAGIELVECFVRFDLPHGEGQGMVRLSPPKDPGETARALVLFTDLAVLHGVAERGVNRVSVANRVPLAPLHGYEPAHSAQTYGEYLTEKQAFADYDPDVLVIGGGHGGMSVGARLERMGASYLIVERNAKPGDTWRGRYESLALHTISAINQLPYLDTPESFSDYSPKDQWADWIDAYPRLMQLNYWTSTRVSHGSFDVESGRWVIDLELADGTARAMRPRHVVLATGGIGLTPAPYDFPGYSDFEGEKLHSKAFGSGRPFAGKRVLVIGSATSAFDVCLDLVRAGAFPVMIQRSPTTVIPLEEGVRYMLDYLPGRGIDRDTADVRRAAGLIYPLMIRNLQRETVFSIERNADLYRGLEAAGLKLDQGPDNTGWLMKLHRAFKGFYIDMGAAQAIIEGSIKIVQASRMARFAPVGLILDDGTQLPFDAVVTATGFLNANEDIAEIFGAEVAAGVGPRVGIDASGEALGQAKPLCHRQVWQMYGSLNDMRRLSRVLALQIVAELRGLVPVLERQDDGTLRKLA